MTELQQILPDETVINKIYFIRGKKVMLDRDLAELYNVETRVLNQAVKRNSKRFPDDFMFQLIEDEYKDYSRSQNVTLNQKIKRGQNLKYLPFAFTEQGVSMLSSVLNSDRAILVSIQIMRIFTKMRELLSSNIEILRKLEILEKKDIEQDEKIMLIFEYIKELEQTKNTNNEQKNRTKIGYRK